jgi:hypothetical protein
MTAEKDKDLSSRFLSKYSKLDKSKLDDLYLTNLLRELWSIPIADIKEYIRVYYPNPTALEMVEINDLLRIVRMARKRKPIPEEDQNNMRYKHTRMYGKPRQIVELSGRDGEAIELSSLDDGKLMEELNSKIGKIHSALSKIKGKDGK